MPQQRRAGEKLFVDYAGPALELADGGRGQVFVTAMGASSYTLACVTADQSTRSWLAAIGRALRFLGSLPQMTVPDNARAQLELAGVLACLPLHGFLLLAAAARARTTRSYDTPPSFPRPAE